MHRLGFTVGSVLVVAAIAAAWLGLGNEPEPGDGASSRLRDASESSSTGSAADSDPHAARTISEPDPSPIAHPRAPTAAERATAPKLIGTCVAAEDARPLASALVEVKPVASAAPSFACCSDERGRFEVVLDPPPREEQRAFLSIEIDGRATLRRLLEPLVAGETRDLGELEFALGHRLVGHVTSSSGEPIAGVAVIVPVESARTDEAGRFESRAVLSSGRHSLHIRRDGWLSQHHGIEVPLREPLSIVLTRGKSIRGVVLDPGGEPIPLVQVHADHALEPRAATSDEKGRFEIFDPVGDATATHLHVLAGITEAWRSSQKIPWGTTDALVVLQRMLAFDLEVVDRESGAPIEEFALHVLPVGSRPEERTLRFPGQHPGGRVLVSPIDRGEKRLWVVPEGDLYAPCEREALVIADGPPIAVRVELERRSEVHVEVVGGDGRPISAARVELVRAPLSRPLHVFDTAYVDASGLMRSAYGRPALLDRSESDERGRAVLRSMPLRPQLTPQKSGLPPEVFPALHLQVFANGFAPACREMPASSSSIAPLRIALPRCATIAGRLVPRSVLELKPKIWIEPLGIAFAEPMEGRDEVLPIDAEGRFALACLPAGEYVVRARIGKLRLEEPVARCVLAEGEAQEIAVDLQAFAPAHVRVRVNGAGGGTSLEFMVWSASGVGTSYESRASGRLDHRGVLAELPVLPGKYELVLMPHAVPVMLPHGPTRSHCSLGELTLTSGERCELTFDYRPRRLEISVRCKDGTWPRKGAVATLREGHLEHRATFDERGALRFEPGPTSPFVFEVLGERHPAEGSFEPAPGDGPWQLDVALRR